MSLPQKFFCGLSPTFFWLHLISVLSAILFPFQPKPLVEDFTSCSFFNVPCCKNPCSPSHTGLTSPYIKQYKSFLFESSSRKNRELTLMSILPTSFYFVLLLNFCRYVVSTTFLSLQMRKQRPRVVNSFAQGQLVIGRTGS